MSDFESQQDELLALESIFNSYEFKINENKEQPGGQFFAHIDLIPNFKVEYRHMGTNGIQWESFNVIHLPPLVLYFTLPSDYPSADKPSFCLSCKWLNRSKLTLLCHQLDKLWNENHGMEILFIWTQFLKEESLQFLGMNEKLDISSLCLRHERYIKKLKQTQGSHRSKRREDPGTGGRQETLNTEPLTSLPVRNKPTVIPDQSSILNIVQVPLADLSLQGGVCEEKQPSQNYSNSSSSVYKQEDPKKPNQGEGAFLTCGQSYRQPGRASNSRPSLSNQEKSQVTRRAPSPPVDNRAVLDLSPMESVCEVLQEYDLAQQIVVFERSPQECTVCFSNKPGSECICFNNCGHIFCKDCITAYFEVQIRDGNVQSLKCLEDKCDTEALPSQVKQVLSEDMFAKYDAALLTATLDTMSDILYCPRRSCQYPVSVEPEEPMAQCPACQYVFCVYCKMVYHGVESCRLKSDEQKRLVSDYSTGSTDTRNELEKRYGRKQLQKLVDTVLSEKWVSENSQACPHCKVSIEKSQGCNKMVCWRCNSSFCWLCGTILSHTFPYLHFNNPNSRCFNKLFEGVDINDEDDMDMFWDEED